MLTIPGRPTRYCDGVTRRGFLTIGGLGVAGMGLGLADVLRAEGAAGIRNSHKAVINVFLAGGPPHQDMWEIKTDAPSEIRGEFKPIDTSVPGIQICEMFPRIARTMDTYAVIRSIVNCSGDHDGYQCLSGWSRRDMLPLGGRPSIGSVVARLQGPVDRSIPPSVALARPSQHRPWSEPGGPGFLGAASSPFIPDGPGMANLTLNGVTTDTLADRRRLLTSLDGLKRDLDANGSLRGMDAFTERALGVLTSSKLLDALDVSKEHPRVRERYGDGKPYNFQYDGPPTCNDQLLMARRLVEAGVRCVTISYGRWDSHGANFALVRDHGPKLDQCVSALVEDLECRGMLKDVTVIVWGEFGRTPRINKDAGRDHWPQVSCCLLAGGGMKVGQAIGATNRLGEYAKDRPVTMQSVVATVYQNLGLDPRTVTINDPTGRPQYLVDDREPVAELVG